MIKAITTAAMVAIANNISVSADDLPSSRRRALNFNRDWRFLLGDHEGAHQATYDDANWQRVGLPHSFSLPYFLSAEFYTGYGWYRKRFNVPSDWTRQRVFLDFEGAFQQVEVFVNGIRVGEHVGGYTGFSIDITSAVIEGENTVAVRVNNVWKADVAPRAGEHVFSGGLYRNVTLVVTDPLHVDWYGTFVTTPTVSREVAAIHVATEICNDSSSARKCRVETAIIDPSGKHVTSVSSTQTVAPNSKAAFDQTTRTIENPELWSPEHPRLYTAVTTVFEGERDADVYVTPFGIRWFEFTKDRGFFLNGEHRYLVGANVHQDHAGWGDAVTNSGLERDVTLVAEAGFDFIRGSHYPKAPAFTEACDRQGVLLLAENCFWGIGGGHKEGGWSSSAYPPIEADEAKFEASVKASLRDMIRVHRNHPSIIVWSMSNEPFFSDAALMPKVRAFLKELVEYSHELDPSRPAAIGGAQRGEIDHLGDIAAYNGDGARLFVDPGIPSIVTEYGSTICDRPGEYQPGWGDLPNVTEKVTDKPYPWRFAWRSGEAIWCGFDHGSIAGHFGCMGIVDYFRLPKRSWYWYRNAYKGIAPPNWPENAPAATMTVTTDKAKIARTDGTDDVLVIVTILGPNGQPVSATPPVTLTVESGPGEFPTGRSIHFDHATDIPIRDGKAAIEMRAYHAGRTVLRATSPGLPDATLDVVSEGGPEYIQGRTPDVAERPYARYTSKANVSAAAPANVALLRPTFASSEAVGHPALFGSDGDNKTYWMAGDATNGAWWMSDLEGTYAITAIEIAFPWPTESRYDIDVSLDKLHWSRLPLPSAPDLSTTPHRYTFEHAVIGAFVRITFTGVSPGKQAALTEVQVIGVRR